MFEFLPRSLRRLYLAILNPIPFARSTRVRTEPEPAPKPEEITPEARERIFRVEIIQDAYCKQRPAPKRLFKKQTFHRRMEAWCERPAASILARAAPRRATSISGRSGANGRPNAGCTGAPSAAP